MHVGWLMPLVSQVFLIVGLEFALFVGYFLVYLIVSLGIEVGVNCLLWRYDSKDTGILVGSYCIMLVSVLLQ